MKIGIDARFLTHPQRGGFKTYTENLIRSILEIDQENQYVIYIDRVLEDSSLQYQDNVNFRVVSVDIPGLGMPVREQVFLRKEIKRDRLDLVHFLCNTAPIGISGDYILTLHDTIQIERNQVNKLSLGKAKIKNWALSQYSKWTILGAARKARRVIAVSSFEKARINQILDIPRERIQVILEAPNPIYSPADSITRNDWRVELNKIYGIQNKYLLTVGYEPRKNIPILIHAFALLRTNHEDLVLVIVASNDERGQDFYKLAHDLNVSDQVIILGKVPDQDMIKLYNLAEIFIFPSEREGFGLPPLEAIACGTPTIAMKMSSLPEILDDGALFVDSKDPEAWAGAIKHLLSDETLRQELIAKGLRRSADFSWHRCARETIQVYRQVVY